MAATDIIAVIALIGALLSLILQLVETRRRDEEIRFLRDEAKRRTEELRLLGQQVKADEEERHEERLRQKQARLGVFAGVHSELEDARRAISDAWAGNKWPPGWQNKTWSDTWSNYRSILAAEMPKNDFQTLALAYTEMEHLQAGLAAEVRELSDEDKRFLRKTDDLLKRAAGLNSLSSNVAD